MTIRKRHALIAFGAVLLLVLLQLFNLLKPVELSLYDLFLHVRPEKVMSQKITLLDVDDNAIDSVGEWPWPRAVVASGLVRLKEFNAEAAVFDIEFVNQSKAGIDTVYYTQHLPGDFQRSFNEIAGNVSDLIGAMSYDQIDADDLAYYAEILGEMINDERDGLYQRTQNLIQDNDIILGQAAALYGRAWGTVNLQAEEVRQADDGRKERAQERFSYPVQTHGNYAKGGNIDIIPPIPSFLEAVKGAGFTNVLIDPWGGVRRRISLAQNIDGHWYLQLAFAPLVNSMGNPELEFKNRSLLVKDAIMPDGSVKSFSIPLDKDGNMLIDWPKGTYWEEKSYHHFSFRHLTALDEEENVLKQLLLNLYAMDIWSLLDSPTQLSPERRLLYNAVNYIDDSEWFYDKALLDTDEDAFESWLTSKDGIRETAREFVNGQSLENLHNIIALAKEQYPDYIDYFESEYSRAEAHLLELGKAIANVDDLREKCKNELEDRICIIGWVGSSTTDIGVNPFDGRFINVGTHSAVAETILGQSFIRYLDDWVSIVMTLILVPALLLFMGRFKVGIRAAFGFGGSITIFLASMFLFALTGIFVSPLPTVIAAMLGVIVRELVDFISTEKEKSFLREEFGTYLSEEVIEQIMADPSKRGLGGESRYMTSFFTDIKGFSTISEQLSPEALVTLLNKYLSGMSDIILDEQGLIDKYIGDAIVAMFGAPVDLPEHAQNACRSAILMKRLEAEMNQEFMEDSLIPFPVATRIGINTGEMVVGNMGTDRKKNYTIMGSAVNLAARLEGVNKKYGTWILLSQETLDKAGEGFLTRRLDRVRVVGINEPVQLWQMMDFLEDADDETKAMVRSFDDALKVFEAREYKEAKKLFKGILSEWRDDGPSKYYIETCERFIKTPPPEKWDGVFNLTEK